jgi:hypothetical protein
MSSKAVSMLLIVGLSVCALPSLLRAEAPFEQYHVAVDSIAQDVLKETIGILTINSGASDVSLPALHIEHDSISSVDTVSVQKETLPLSNFGYAKRVHLTSRELDSLLGDMKDQLGSAISHDRDGIEIDVSELSAKQKEMLGGPLWHRLQRLSFLQSRYVSNYRYPVTGVSGDTLEIVIDPTTDQRIRFRPADLSESVNHRIVWVDSLGRAGNTLLMDCFKLAEGDTIRLFAEPSLQSQSELINDSQYGYFDIVDQQDGFVRAGVSHQDPSGDWVTEPLGWIEIRDNQGRLRIWIVMQDRY